MRLLNKIRVSALVCTLGFLPGAEAQTQADSDHIYFRQGSSVIDSSIGDNGRILESWSERFPGSDEFPEMPELRILLRGSACPDGSTATSERLAEERAAVLCGWLCEHTSIPRERITVTACGIDWQGLEELVIADTACPARAEVLHILQNTPEWICDARDRVIDGRKKQLMDLRGGIPYKYMAEKMFPALRNVAVVVSGEAATAASGESAPLAGSETPKSPPLHSGPEATDSDALVEAVAESAASDAGMPAAAAVAVSDAGMAVSAAEDAPQEPLHRLAVKTNLLYDAILMPSLEVECRIDDRWSVAVEGDVAWWKRDSAHKYYQISTILAEGRYWFHTKQPWHGHYVGLFAGGSWYDLENGARGYKGEFWTAGISYGYMFPIGRSWSFEAGLGVGFLRTRYEEYLPLDGHYVYQQTSRTNWLGPVKVKFALVYRLWDINRKGGRK